MRFTPVAAAVAASASAFVAVLATMPLAGAASSSFDDDMVTISGSGASLTGSVIWSRADERVIRGRFIGTLDSATGDCARVRVDWLDSGADTIGTAIRSVCAGAATEFKVRKGSTALECVRVRLLVADGDDYDRTGPTRLVCAGGA